MIAIIMVVGLLMGLYLPLWFNVLVLVIGGIGMELLESK